MFDVFRKVVHRSFTMDVDIIVHQFKMDTVLYSDVFVDLSEYGLGHWIAKGTPSGDVKNISDGYISEYTMFNSVASWDMVARIDDDVWSINTTVKIVNDFLNIKKEFTRNTKDYSEIYGRVADILPSILEQCGLKPIQMDRWDMVKRQVSY